MKRTIFIIYLTCLFHAILGYTFPDDFIFGVATASYQVEGAWDINGKGENVWDRLTHTRPDLIDDNSNGDIACDTYHKTIEDVQLLKELGVDFYRFSISWSRILPTGQVNNINGDGIRYYNELIDELLDNEITPMVTMFHWDLPQALQEIGGWPSPRIAEYFVDYADLLFAEYGDRVKTWITFNEPTAFCQGGYSDGGVAPAYNQDGIGGYLCSYTTLIAHANTYRLYDEKYRDTQNGKIGIAVATTWFEPDSSSEEDIQAAYRQIQMDVGWFVHPIFSEEGDYPQVMRDRIDAASAAEGFTTTRLPYFTEDEIQLIKGTADFFGLNHYTSALCTTLPEGTAAIPSFTNDIGSYCSKPDSWEASSADWLRVTPWGFRNILNWVKDEYNNPEVIVTENGFANSGDLFQDCRRINYYNLYLEALLDAIYEDDCNVVGYAAWSFMDNFEWRSGYTQRFGLYHVDFEDDDRPRTAKMSAYVYRNIIETGEIDWNYTPEGFDPCEGFNSD